MLKGCRCICQTQRHNNILKQTHRRQKGHFVFVAFFNSNLVVSARQVNSTEHSRFTKLIKQVMDTRDWKHVEACLFIQVSKINTHSKLSCLFPHKQDRGTIWQDAGANPTRLPACHLHATKPLQVHWQTNGITCGEGGWHFHLPNQLHGQVLCEEPNPEFERHPKTHHTKQHTMHQSGLSHPQALSGHHMALLEQANKLPLVQIAK